MKEKVLKVERRELKREDRKGGTKLGKKEWMTAGKKEEKTEIRKDVRKKGRETIQESIYVNRKKKTS